MLTLGNYMIHEDIENNRLIISLPATDETGYATSAIPREDRRVHLSAEQLTTLLKMAYDFYHTYEPKREIIATPLWSHKEEVNDERYEITWSLINICSHCGNEITPNNYFCSKCGSKIDWTQIKEP